MRPAGIFDIKYATDLAIVRTRFQWLALIGGLALLFTAPIFLVPMVFENIPVVREIIRVDTLNYMGIFIIAVMGLQLVTGYAGQISFGQCALMGVGAYSSAIIANQIGTSWAFWVALPLAGLIAALVGIVVGAPSLRIKGFYLALATLAAHYILAWLFYHLPITGANRGIYCAAPQIGGFVLNTDFRMFFLIMIAMVLMTFLARNLIRTRTGRAFVAIRDNDIAAETMGVNVYRYKLLAFFIACFFAGIAGSLWAHWTMVVHPDFWTLLWALWFIGMIIIGGVSSISGVFFGVVFLKVLDELMLWLAPNVSNWFPAIGTLAGASLSAATFGLILIVFLIFEPRGLAHRWELAKASLRLYPFPY